MRSRVIRALFATTLVACMLQPAAADEPGIPIDISSSGAQQTPSTPLHVGVSAAGYGTTTLLPDERDEPLRLLALIGPALAIGVLTILGVTISVRELRHDMRRRRIVYRQQSGPGVRRL